MCGPLCRGISGTLCADSPPKKSAQKSLINSENKDTTIYDNNLNKLLINYAFAWRTGTITVKTNGGTI
jgi:hypothetical protein